MKRRQAAVSGLSFFYPNDIVAKIRAAIVIMEEGSQVTTVEMADYRKGFFAALRAVAIALGVSISDDGKRVWNSDPSLRGYSLAQIGASIDAADSASHELTTTWSKLRQMGFTRGLEALSTAFKLEEVSGPAGFLQKQLL